MTVEILFGEICNLYGETANVTCLKQMLPDARFVETALNDPPFFVSHAVDMIYIGAMRERDQRKIIEKLLPFRGRILQLIENNVAILATGNAGEIFTKHISYITEKKEINALGVFDAAVEVDLFHRTHGKLLGLFEGMEIVGFYAGFSKIRGRFDESYFLWLERGKSCYPDHTEGMKKKNLICTSLLGPILPLNPMFAELFVRLAGEKREAPFRKDAIAAYNQRLAEFRDPKVRF